MAWTQVDIDRLKAAVASGTKSVQYADKMVTYQSLAEMLQALQAMEAEVAGAGGLTSTRRTTLASFTRE